MLAGASRQVVPNMMQYADSTSQVQTVGALSLQQDCRGVLVLT